MSCEFLIPFLSFRFRNNNPYMHLSWDYIFLFVSKSIELCIPISIFNIFNNYNNYFFFGLTITISLHWIHQIYWYSTRQWYTFHFLGGEEWEMYIQKAFGDINFGSSQFLIRIWNENGCIFVWTDWAIEYGMDIFYYIIIVAFLP